MICDKFNLNCVTNTLIKWIILIATTISLILINGDHVVYTSPTVSLSPPPPPSPQPPSSTSTTPTIATKTTTANTISQTKSSSTGVINGKDNGINDIGVITGKSKKSARGSGTLGGPKGSTKSARAPKTLYTAGFFPLNSKIPEGSIGRGVMPAVNLALKHINADPTILSGYTLDIVPKDTECDPAVGMKAFFDMIHGDPKKLILFGDACTSVTDPIAKASKFFNLIQLSYADTHPMYTSESYPNFYRVVPSEAAFNPARLALLQRFNWTKVGTLYENHPRYSLPHSKLLTDLDKVNIKFKFTQSISEDIQLGIEKLKAESVRIILGNFGEDFARKIFCEAYKHDLYGRKYQWIISGGYRDRWWESEGENASDCTNEELVQALEGYIATDVLTLSSSKDITASGLTASQYEKEYDLKRDQEFSKFHGYAYDGMWTIAFALENVISKLSDENFQNSKEPDKPLNKNRKLKIEDFDYKNRNGTVQWADIFRSALNETFFIGVTGNVSFDGNERRGSILLKQFQDGREVKIGEYHSTTDVLDLEVGENISWRGGSGPPVDEIIKITVASRISLTLFIVISVFAVMGIILALVFLSMNIKYRKQRYIKMSSPYLNNLIIIGCILTYTSVILLGLDSRLLSEANFPYICAARSWVLMSGFTLAFGSMFSKTWRVHAIFTNIKLNKKVIKDYKLFMVVGILVFIDVATLTTWQIVDPFYRGTHSGIPKPSPENEDVHIVPQMEFCDSKKMTIFLGSIYVYKGLLMAFGCFLAWETRHVSIPALNDSKYIGMSVYNVVIMCVIGAGLSFVLKEQQDAAFVIISIFIIFCSTATLCLVFVPKLIELKRNPDMDERRSRPTLKPLKKSRKESDEMELHQRIKVLTEFNTRQRQRLKEKTFELEALMFRLRQYGIEMGTNNEEIIIKPKEPPRTLPSTITSTSTTTTTTVTETVTCSSSSGSNLLPGIKKLSADKQICLLLAEKDSSTFTRSEKDTSFISLSASISLVSGSVEELISSIGNHSNRKSHNHSCPELPKGGEGRGSVGGGAGGGLTGNSNDDSSITGSATNVHNNSSNNNNVRRRKVNSIDSKFSSTIKDMIDNDNGNKLQKPSTSSTPSDLVKDDYELSDDAIADDDDDDDDDDESDEDAENEKVHRKSTIINVNDTQLPINIISNSDSLLPVEQMKTLTSNSPMTTPTLTLSTGGKVLLAHNNLICDETSYSMAIKASLHGGHSNGQGYNGFCSSCEEDDTEKGDQTATLSEESDQSFKPDFNPRRTKSLSAITYKPETSKLGGHPSGHNGNNSNNNNNVVSLVDNGSVSLSKGTLLVHPVFPFLSQLTKKNINPVNPSDPNSDYHASPYWPMFSSYPSIKCDIVEYL
ncbi:gamma-aminobutyric acid type B receptor subunit 2-like isoform X2 [Panonychus citri]|uniref:gamma-aminobutyric acid type B receptor subunit 2-like isoform X2 n=1 Tax=Panonychus citri TaxID=50023 RepID=UPI0023071D45|nr:gamma-aminobutyric acid type B receptor subunit 2-like isoform X2 [Panonychus citri]